MATAYILFRSDHCAHCFICYLGGERIMTVQLCLLDGKTVRPAVATDNPPRAIRIAKTPDFNPKEWYEYVPVELFDACELSNLRHLQRIEELEEECAELRTLKEERTCEWTLEHSGTLYDKWKCSECGYEYVESRTDSGATELVPNYCPNCGSRVVE